MMSTHKNAFTLIELSIVLVIISLIAAGIVGGKSLIESAKLQNIIRDSQSYQSAWNNFKVQYNSIPGDLSNALDYWNAGCLNGNSWCEGNGNNLIDSQFVNNSEGVAAMLHLKLAETIEGSLAPGSGYSSFRYPSPGESHSSSSYHYNVPMTDLGYQEGKDGWVFASHGTRGDSNWFGRHSNWLVFGSVTQGRILDGAIINQKQAATIDKKIDDGLPTTGKVTATTGSSSSSSNTTAASPNCITGGAAITYSDRDITTNYSTLVYNVTEKNRSCVLHFDLGQ